MKNNKIQITKPKGKIKTIDVWVKTHKNKTYGYLSASARVTVNYGLDSETVYRIPFQYVRSWSQQSDVLRLLTERGIIPTSMDVAYTLRTDRSKILLRFESTEDKAKECKEFGKASDGEQNLGYW